MTNRDTQQEHRMHVAQDYYELCQMNSPGLVMVPNQLEAYKHETAGQSNISQVARR
jgi:hypothetical protein